MTSDGSVSVGEGMLVSLKFRITSYSITPLLPHVRETLKILVVPLGLFTSSVFKIASCQKNTRVSSESGSGTIWVVK